MKYITPVLILFLIGCNFSSEKKVTYLGGKIINPKSDVVIFSDNLEISDTIKLNKDNTFLAKINVPKEGLYYFKHGPEYQYVYFTPGDSLSFRLNTWDFDESLVFSGINADRNNLLIQCYLDNELDVKWFSKHYNDSPKNFKIKIDSALSYRKEILKEFKQDNPQESSSKFLELLKISLEYPIYAKNEEYSINYHKKNKGKKLDDSYFEYQKNTKNNSDSLILYHPYSYYITNKVYNDVYRKGINSKSENYTLELLKTIDENFSNKKIKNDFLFQTIVNSFYDDIDNEKAIETFLKLNDNKENKKIIQLLISDSKALKEASKLPNFEIIGTTLKKSTVLPKIKNKNAVIYFRNDKFSSDEWVASRIRFLQKLNPSTLFLVINLNKNEAKPVEEIEGVEQFILSENSTAKAFTKSKYPRVIIINKEGKVLNGFSSLSSTKINQQVKALK